MKKTTTYEFNLPEGSDPADIAKINENMTLIDRLMSQFLLRAHPVGSYYYSDDPADPSTLFGGTWERLKDRFLLAAGDVYQAGETGGSADAVVVAHTHTVSGTAENAGAHTHTITASSESAGAHTHTISGTAESAGAHTHTITASTASAGGHTHTATTASAGAHTHSVSGTAASAGNHNHQTINHNNQGQILGYGYEVSSYVSLLWDSGKMQNSGAHWHSVYGTAASNGAHTHTLTTSSNGAHTHTVTASSASAGAHTHTVSGTAESAGSHTHAITASSANAGAHAHTVSGNTASAGVSGAGKNMPPHKVVYCWKRTA